MGIIRATDRPPSVSGAPARVSGRAAAYAWFVPRVLPLLDRVRGRRVWARLQQLREHQWRSADEVEAAAAARLRELLAHAVRHVPYYRRLLGDAGIQPEAVRNLSDLARIPVTTRGALQAAGFDQTTADNAPARRGWDMLTSGSSGVPFRLRLDLASEDTRLASFMLGQEWAGVGVWDAEVSVSNPFRPADLNYPRPGRLDRLGRRVLLGRRSGHLQVARPAPEDLLRLVRSTAGRRTWYLKGLPSILALLGDRFLRAGIRLPTDPKVVITGSESLTGVRRATIAEAFRAPVVDRYTCNEMAHIAQSCPDGAGGLHLLGDRVIVHVARGDGHPAAPGERGRVLLTDLENRVMPLINYDVGDVAVAGSACPCGRGLPVLAAVEGREADTVRLPSGDRISALTLETCLLSACDVGALREYQIAQTAVDRLRINLVATPRLTAHDAERLRRGFEELLGPGMAVEVAEVDEIEAGPSGKRSVVKAAGLA